MSKYHNATCLLFLQCFLFVNTQLNAKETQLDSLQPYAPHWFIDELLVWTPEKDAFAPFNRSRVPLGDKVCNCTLKVNPHSRCNEAKIESLSIFGNTHNTPSQGALNPDFYAFTYWEYCDLMVYWGGSSGEGIILSPVAGVIDAAHRHGVPIYGTVFFPPIVYGGRREWVYDFVQQDDKGHFPVADKLIEVAQYYGFDGWFINQETGNAGEVEPDAELAHLMQEMMLYIQRNSDVKIQWYDAMLNDGTVRWQHEINEKNAMFFHANNEKVSDQMFLDFRYTTRHLTNTKQMVDEFGRDIYDVYAGIDVQTNGYDTDTGYVYPQGANFDVLFPEGQAHRSSLAFYVPSWTQSSSSSLDEFYAKESRFWVGENGDPSNTETTHNWKGVAHYVPAKTSITQLPFVTSFCTGQGFHFFKEGEDLSSPRWTKGWHNLSLQDLQPNWKWMVEGDEAISLAYDFSDAYNGGNCLSVNMPAQSRGVIPLYSTVLDISHDNKAIVTYKKNNVALQLAFELTFSSGEKYIIQTHNSSSSDWSVDTLNLQSFEGQRLLRLALVVSSSLKNESSELKIGLVGVVDMLQIELEKPQELSLMAKSITHDKLSVSLSWRSIQDDDVLYYRLYKMDNEKPKMFLGATTSDVCYLPHIPYKENEEAVIVGVERVNTAHQCSGLTTISISTTKE